jgi:trk system potassium uptake protein
MRARAVLKALGYLLVVFSVAFLLPIITGLYFAEPVSGYLPAYLLPLVISATVGGALLFLGKGEEDLRDREAMITVSFAWLIISFLGSLPYIMTGALASPVDAFFESVSGFTTTGLSVITNVEDFMVTPRSLLLWRAETQLLGGMGIIVLSMVVLSRVVGGSTQLFRAEAAPHLSTRIRPSIRQIAGSLWLIYLAFTGLEIFLLWLAGMGPFDAVCHSFATLATGGFSTKNASITAFNAAPAIGTIVTIFMLLGAMNFTVHYDLFTGNVRRALRNSEARLYIGILLVGAALIFLSLLFQAGDRGSYLEMMAHSMFQATSAISSTGFSTVVLTGWPSAGLLVLIALMLIGGCSGSTAGAMKAIRFIILVKVVRNEISKVLHPHAVLPITLGGRSIPSEVARNVISYFFIYMSTFFLVALGLAFAGMTVLEAVSHSASALGNVGLAFGNYGLIGNFSTLHPAGKLLLAAAMWMGRLEVYPALLLLSPRAYR